MNQIVIGQPVVDWMIANHDEFAFIHPVAIGVERNKKLIAGVAFESYNGANINMHVLSIDKNWINKEFLWMCFDYPFNQLKVNRITGVVAETNLAARRFDEHVGFKLETTLMAVHL
jgi:RimJ/RimL family protein N-acetyltransferase